MMSINATLQVEPSADWIWAVITHFAKYAEWNRLIPRIEGEAQLNRRLRLTVAPTERRAIALRARVLVAARNRELRWCARSRLPKLLRIEHGFRIEQRAGGCRLHHGVSVDGWLASERLIAGLHDAFEATNAALKARAAAATITTAPPTLVVTPPAEIVTDALRHRVVPLRGSIAAGR